MRWLQVTDLEGGVHIGLREGEKVRILREPHEAVGVPPRVLGHLVQRRVHVHPLVPVRPHLGLGDEDLLDARLVHLAEHGGNRVELRQAAVGALHPADQLALLAARVVGGEAGGELPAVAVLPGLRVGGGDGRAAAGAPRHQRPGFARFACFDTKIVVGDASLRPRARPERTRHGSAVAAGRTPPAGTGSASGTGTRTDRSASSSGSACSTRSRG